MSRKIGYYIVGDIHGCYEEFLVLEKKIYRHAIKRDFRPVIVSVGDLVDRGPDTKKVVEHFVRGRSAKTHVSILGNHELMMLEILHAFVPALFRRNKINLPPWFESLEDLYRKKRGVAGFVPWDEYKIHTKVLWIGQGGYATLKSYGCDPERPRTWGDIPPDHISYLSALPIAFEKSGFIVTHAPPQKEHYQRVKKYFLARKFGREYPGKVLDLKEAVSSLVWNRSLDSLNVSTKKMHLSGHTALKRVRRFNSKNHIQLDTAVFRGGNLTAWCAETGDLLRVKAGGWSQSLSIGMGARRAGMVNR